MVEKKYLLKFEDYVDAPLPALGKFTRKMIIDSSTVGAKDLTFLYGRYDKGATGEDYEKKCSHPRAEEILYITGGKGYVGIDDKEYLAGKGDTIWVPKNVIHWAYNPFDEPFEMICIYSRASLKEAGLVIHEQ